MSRDLTVEIKAQNKELKQKLAESKRELNEFKRAVKEANSAGGSSSKGMGGLSGILESIGLKGKNASGVMGMLTGSLGKVAGALGLAMGAAEGFNKMIESSNALGDEMERIQMQVGSAVTYFSSCLANVDFSNFWQGLQNSITGGGELADVLDRINTAMQQLGVRSSKIDVDIAKKELQIATLPKGSEKRIQLEKELLKLTEQRAKFMEPIIKDQHQGARDLMKSALGFDDKQMAKYSKVIDAYLEGGNGAYEKIGNAWKTIQKYRYGSAGAPGTTNWGEKGVDKDAEKEYKHALAVVNAYAKKAGVSFKVATEHARNFFRIYDVSDNGPESTGFKARQLESQANAGEASGIRQQAAIQQRITMEKQKANKMALKAQKEQEALAKKTYTANAKTIAEMKANVTYLEEKKDKTLPSSEEFSKITTEIKYWKKEIEAIEFDDNTLEGLQAQLKSINEELARTKKGSEQFNTLKGVAKSLQHDIEDLSMDEYVLNPRTEKEIEGNIARLKWKMADLEPNTDEWKRYSQEIEELQEMMQMKPAKDSLADIQKQIHDIQKILEVAPLSIPARIRLLDDMSELQSQYDQKSKGVALSVPAYKRSSTGNSQAANYESASTSITTIQQDYEIGIIGYEDAKAKVNEINAALQKLGMEPIEIRIVSKGVQKTAKALNVVGDTLEGVSDAFSALGAVAEDPALDVAGIIAGAIANIMMGYATASVAAAQSGNPWVWIAFAIAGLATAMAAAASIKSATGGFAEGGIVGGASPIGDRLYARVNSGEMILNGSQQANLFKAIDDGRLGGEAGVGEVSFVLRGSDLYGSLKNYGLMKARAGKTIKIG